MRVLYFATDEVIEGQRMGPTDCYFAPNRFMLRHFHERGEIRYDFRPDVLEAFASGTLVNKDALKQMEKRGVHKKLEIDDDIAKPFISLIDSAASTGTTGLSNQQTTKIVGSFFKYITRVRTES